jgi:hypothetical protein
MKTRKPLTRIGLLPLAALPIFALAQALDVANLVELDDDREDVKYQDLTVDQLEDMDLVRNGEVIGEVEAVLATPDGEIVALVVEYGGNLIGLGKKQVVVPIDDLDIPPGVEEIEIAMTDAELDALEAWRR